MKRALAALAAITALIGAEPAMAQGTDEFGAYGGLEHAGQVESPQNVAVELRFGRYLPRVDDEFSQATPFRDIFGDSNRYLVGLEVDWQALRIPHFGSFGPGLGWGYTTMSAGELVADGSGGRAKQDTSLTIMPFYLVGVMRVDVIARETAVPLVPYAKAGIGYALWWVGDGDKTAESDGVTGRGRSYGWQFALGGMFLLDVLDRDAAVQFDNTTGVNNAYLFIEWYNSMLDGFGGGGQMNVGASTWMLGLALEI